MLSHIPIIDIFAGPGGLGEGFSRYSDKGRKPFRIHLSIEKQPYAHETLKLRAFFRSFSTKAPNDYFRVMKGECTLHELYAAWPENHKHADEEAWQATLGEVQDEEIDARIRKALGGRKEWLLVGGPPCQAYSIVGRSRNRGISASDKKVGLYKQYLRIVAQFRPTVFVMENVKGLLSANLDGSIFSRILNDLGSPTEATGIPGCPGYRIHSFVEPAREVAIDGLPVHKATDFLIRSEDYGIPQTRHRVLLLGIRKDVEAWPTTIRKHREAVSCAQVISDLPRIRSGLSKEDDSFEAWSSCIHSIHGDLKKSSNGHSPDVKSEIDRALQLLRNPRHGLGAEFIPGQNKPGFPHDDWYLDDRIGGFANHAARGHIASDLRRYFFASCYARALTESPKLEDFPRTLLPAHKNVGLDGIGASFSDRFRVQLQGRPATTVTSHISKDGHYFIHFDPTQCRSLTVREAARLQTFPDNYFFCGNRTQQYEQVGNAVPPLLAKKLASVVWKIMEGRT